MCIGKGYTLKNASACAIIFDMRLHNIQSDTDLLNLKKEDHVIFIDESGDDRFYEDSKVYEDKSISPCLTILALIVKKENYHTLIKEIRDMKQQMFGDENVVLTSRNIRNKIGAFSILQDDNVYDVFKDLVIDAIDHANAVIVSCSVNKHFLLQRKQSIEEHGREYTVDPLYEMCCKFMFERVCHLLKREKATAHFCFEKIGRKESKKMENFIENLKCEGSVMKTKSKRFGYKKEHYEPVTSYSFPAKSLNITGTQIADYCAHPFAKRCRYGDTEEENDLFTLLKKYIYQGDRHEYGLKEWPQKLGRK